MASEKLVGKVKAITWKFKWDIENFHTSCAQANVGDFVESPTFITSLGYKNVEWKLLFYPRGQTPDCKDYLSLYLNVRSKGKIGAVANFKILNKQNQMVLEWDLEKAIFDHKTAYGADKLIPTDIVLDPASCILNINGKLTIICEIATMPRYKMMGLKLNKKVEVQEGTSRVEMLDNYEELMKDCKFSDVTLIAENKKLRVHKCILGKSSSVFAAIFNAEMHKNQQIVVEMADDIRYHVLVEMIRFVYTGKVNSIEKLVGELAIVASKYALHRLVIMCEEVMIKSMSCDSIIDYLLLADKLKLSKLKMKGIQFIVESGHNVIDKPEFRSLPCDIILEVCSTLAKKYKP